MNIAIIGAGNVGKALGATFARAGHRVIYAARSADSAHRAAQEVGGQAFSVAEAAQRADIIVLAIPYVAAHEVASEIASVATGKIVIDPTNPVKSNMTGLETQGGPSAAENLQVWLRGAHVVKAFNTLFARVQADPRIHGVEVDALFATDDEDARARLNELLSSIGFRPVYVGPLVRARELEAIG